MDSFKYKEINLFNNRIDKTKKYKNQKKYILSNDKLFNKEEYLKKNVNLKEDKNNILYGLFQKFYNLKYGKNIYLSLIADKRDMLSYLNKKSIYCLNNENITLGVKKNIFKEVLYRNVNKEHNNYTKSKIDNKYYSFYNNINFINMNKKFKNSTNLWDNLDYSIINILSNLFNKDEKSLFKFSSYGKLFNKINNIIINSNMLYLDLIKKEFYNINRDVIQSKVKQEK